MEASNNYENPLENNDSQDHNGNKPNLPLPPSNSVDKGAPDGIEIAGPIINLSEEKHDSRFYNRLGFYCALDTIEDPNQKFLELQKAQSDLIAEQRLLLNEYFSEKTLRYDARIIDSELKIESEKARLTEYLELKVPASKAEAETFCKIKTELESNFSARIVEFGKRKLDLVESAIKAARANLDSIIDNFQKSYEKRFGFNDNATSDNKAAIATRTRQYELLRDQSEKQLQRLVLKMERLGFDGLNPAFGHWLFMVGLTISMICGAYFFAVFALSKGISDSNVPFFLLKGAANFVHDFFPDYSIGERLLWLMGCFLGFSLAMAAISWLAWIGLRQLDKSEGLTVDRKRLNESNNNDAESQFDLSSERELSFELRSTGSDFLRFWLKTLPIALITGLVFLLVFLTLEKNTSGVFDELSDLDISLTGATVGALLTIMFGGLFSVYILKVVEPRTEKSETIQSGQILKNIELVISGILFLFALFSLFFMENRIAGSSNSFQPSIIFIYGVLVLTNGYLLGYALRIRAMFGTRNYLERRTILLARAIRNGVLPFETSLTRKEDKVFKQEYSKIQRELFNLLLLKTQLGNQALGGKNANKSRMPIPKPILEKPIDELPKPKPKKWLIQTWYDGVIAFFKTEEEFVKPGSELQKKEDEYRSNVEDWEVRLFPDIATEIEQLGKDLALARLRCREARELVIELEEDKSSFCETIRERVRRLEESMNDLKRNREKIIQEKRHELRALARQSDSIQADIRQGFNLGCWFISNVGSEPSQSFVSNISTDNYLNRLSRNQDDQNANIP